MDNKCKVKGCTSSFDLYNCGDCGSTLAEETVRRFTESMGGTLVDVLAETMPDLEGRE